MIETLLILYGVVGFFTGTYLVYVLIRRYDDAFVNDNIMAVAFLPFFSIFLWPSLLAMELGTRARNRDEANKEQAQ
jgi:hypothetical protein